MEKTSVAYGYVVSNKIFLSGWAQNPDREIGEVRDNDIEKSVQFFTARFAELEGKVNEVLSKIDATENKGSFLMNIVHLSEQLTEHDGLGDYASIKNELEKYETLIRAIIAKNRLRNTEIKSALLLEVEEIGSIINWKEATEKINDLKARWIKTGTADDEHQNQLEEEFWEKIKKFFDRKKHFFEDKQRLMNRRVEQYTDLVKEAEKLEGVYGRQRFSKIKDLKEQWKNLDGIPAQHYKPLHETFYKSINLKPKTPNKIDYTPILVMLEEIKQNNAIYNKKELDIIKNNILKDGQRSVEKKKALHLIYLINEKEFIFYLIQKRFPHFSKLDASKKLSIKVGIVKELISRDKDELRTYEENSINFSSSDGSLSKLVAGKIRNQKKKISIKEELLEMIENGDL